MPINFDTSLTSMLSSSNNVVSNSGPPSGSQNPMAQKVDEAVAKLLGISTTTLQNDLSSGETLSSIASQAGVTSQTLISTIAQTLANNPPPGAPTLSSDQLTTMATDIANGVTPPQPGTGQGTGTSTTGSTTSTSSSSGSSVQGVNTASRLDELAQLLGIDPATLGSSLLSGTTLSQLLDGASSADAAGTSSTGVSLDSLL